EQARFAEKTSARIIEPDASRPLRPNALRRTIRISHGSSFRFGEKTGTVASALVLRRDAQDVWKRFYAGEDPDAFAQACVGRHCHGSRSRPQTIGFVALNSIGKNPRSTPHRLSLLSRHQFCRGQKSRLERRETARRSRQRFDAPQ